MDFNDRVIAEFRANRGRMTGRFRDVPLLLLTMTGARTGRRRTTPLTYLDFEGGLYVFATHLGAPAHPAWYHNVMAVPRVRVEVGGAAFEGLAHLVTGAERVRVWESLVAERPQFLGYERTAGREIPVIRLARLARAEGAGS